MPENVPVQVQIEYKKMDKTRVVRVYTERRKVTDDRSKSESHCDVSVVSLSAVQNTARLAGNHQDYQAARDRLLSTQKLLDRCATTDEQQEEYDIFIREIEKLDECLLELASGESRNKKALMEQATKIFFNSQTVSLVQFQSGSKKDVSSRKKHVGEYKQLI
jgi:hypothetical protein